ncbi:MAG: hypothetical protein K0S65_3904 [Labilithrix sp.]|nr:hypothetical protein [Labilithrix sp.]
MRSILRLGTACFALALVQLGVACAASDDVRPSEEADSGTFAPPADGSPPPISNDDADVDAAPPRECSDDGFCHTALPKNQTLRAVWGDGQGVVWAVSGQGAILRWDQNEWKMHASGLGPLMAVWGSGPTDIWVGGASVLFHGTGPSPGALTFAPTLRPKGDVTSMWGTSANDVWAVAVSFEDAPQSRILHYAPGDDGAVSWSDVPVGPPEMVFSHVWGTAASGVWLGGTMGGPWSAPGRLYRRPNASAGFEPVLSASNPEEPAEEYDPGELMSVSVISDTSMVLLGRTLYGDHTLVRATSTDGGPTFAFAPAAFNGEFNGLWSYAVAGASDDLWVAGEYGRMRHWDGNTWTGSSLTVTKYPVVSDFFAFWVKGPNDLWVVGDSIALHLDPTKKK